MHHGSTKAYLFFSLLCSILFSATMYSRWQFAIYLLWLHAVIWWLHFLHRHFSRYSGLCLVCYTPCFKKMALKHNNMPTFHWLIFWGVHFDEKIYSYWLGWLWRCFSYCSLSENGLAQSVLTTDRDLRYLSSKNRSWHILMHLSMYSPTPLGLYGAIVGIWHAKMSNAP